MYFEKLELIGFKSFADKTTLQFEPGVTAIVGPNGCGKSNISDAIRWALGEQSTKSLRASKMEDVIFSGTDNKEPINFAEVSLTLSNSDRSLPIDYDQVTITRRIFRSGENEYLLNKTPVRLKDINELLMGTGIGTESYSIIEQGKMDLILSSKPEDRRFVFEEASGITKYKSKRKEAMRRLEDTENNLLRINDIILEVKRQISSIERQAKKAEKYKLEFEKLKELDLKISSFEYRNLKSAEKTSSVEKEDAKNREQELAREIGAMNAKLYDFRSRADETSRKVAELSGRYTEARTTFDMNRHKIKVDKERIEESNKLFGQVSEEIGFNREKLAKQEELLRGLEKELSEVRSASAQNVQLLDTKGSRHKELSQAIESMELAVKQCRTRTIDLLSQETHLKNELIKLGAELQNRKARLRRLGVEKETTLTELETQEADLGKAAEAHVQTTGKVQDLKTTTGNKKSTRENLQNEIRAFDESIGKERTTIASLQSKLEFLEDLIKRREGLKTAVKTILSKAEQAPDSFGRIHGVLADLISVEKGYHVAVEAALGEDAQTIIMQTDADVMKAISYLEEQHLGRASFISLERLQRIQAESHPQDAGGQRLTQFIKTSPEFTGLVDHFLRDALLVDSANDALTRNGVPHGVRVITRTGVVFDEKKISGGSLSDGGDVSIVGRRDRINEVRAELEHTRQRIAAIERRKEEKTKTLADLEIDLAGQEELFRKEQLALANFESRKKSLEDVVAKLKEEIAVVDLEMDETNLAVDELTKKGGEHNLKLNSLEQEKAVLQASIDTSITAIEKNRQEKESVLLDETTLRAQAASVEKEVARLELSHEKEEGYCNELKETVRIKQDALAKITDKIKGFEKEIADLEAQNMTLNSSASDLSDELTRLEKDRSDTVDKLSIEELQLKQQESELEKARNQLRDMDLKRMEMDYKMSSLREHVSQAYKVDIETVHVEIDENEDWDSLRIHIQELKARLDDMGQVNLVAIEEHRELEERYSFLVHQQEDLVNAKESLLKAITKINKTTKELFVETFQKIQIEFKDYFRMLFGGGQAELVLIDDQDILESGIEIVARPPGKKLQNIMLLSGGERAMTATALLFAIFKVKPSPFCILDEIDAPLDESNVDRFSKVLRDFVRMSQFIIITHNKKTIELADVMYGITMQERGISKIVSVKFLEPLQNKEQGQEVAA